MSFKRLNEERKFGLQLAIANGISCINNITSTSLNKFDFNNLCPLIADYAYESCQQTYFLFVSGGNSNWSIEDVFSINFSSYSEANEKFKYFLKSSFMGFYDHLLECERRFGDKTLTSLSCLDFMYLEYLFNSFHADAFQWRGNMLVPTRYCKWKIYQTIWEQNISLSSTIHCKRPIRMDFIGHHQLFDWYQAYKNHIDVYVCKQERRESMDAYMVEIIRKLQNTNEVAEEDESDQEENEVNSDLNNFFQNVNDTECCCDTCLAGIDS
jgi:hypothetical protein